MQRAEGGALRLAGLFLAAVVLVSAGVGVHASAPVAAQVTGRFAIDMNLDNGVCDPVDASATVGQNGTIRVAVCAIGVNDAPEAFTVHVGYDTAYLTAPEVPTTAGALDDNPDANAGLTTFGSQSLGEQWDCTSFGVYNPTADDPKTPGGDAKINCNANLSNEDRQLHTGAMVVITFQAGTRSGTTNVKLLPDTVAGYPQRTVTLEYGCSGDPDSVIPCDSAQVTVSSVAATPTPVTPTPGPAQAAAATATRVTFDATQAAIPNGANTGSGPVEQTQTALQDLTPANPADATKAAADFALVAATGTAESGAQASAQKTAQVQAASLDQGSDTSDNLNDTSPENSGGGASKTGLFASIGVGVLIVLAATTGVSYWWWRRRRIAAR